MPNSKYVTFCTSRTPVPPKSSTTTLDLTVRIMYVWKKRTFNVKIGLSICIKFNDYELFLHEILRKYSFSQRVINEWNKLPNDCVNASSVNMFKNRIDRYLIRAGYT